MVCAKARLLLTCIFLACAITHAIGIPVKDAVSIEVSSGGVSLGSYQAGYLYARTLAIRDSNNYRILTGASAGAINMLGGLYYCFHDVNAHPWTPYRSWLEIDWRNLIQKKIKDGHLFKADAVEEGLNAIVDSLLKPPDTTLPHPEAVWMGFAVTRFLPRIVGNADIKGDKMDEKIVLGFQWLMPGSEACPESLVGQGCWRAWTEVDTSLLRMRKQPFLYFGANGTDPDMIRRNLVDLSLASSAFPVAFPRHPIQIWLLDTMEVRVYQKFGCLWKDGKARPAVIPGDKRHPGAYILSAVESGDPDYGKWKATRFPTFSDGGLFENEPLNLARKIRESIALKYGKALDSVKSVRFVSPTNYHPLFADTAEAKVWQSDIPEWLAFFSRRTKSSTNIEVTHFLDESRIPDSILDVSMTHLPLASEHFAHFSGFFNRQFREFDFAVGMYDAFRKYLPGDSLQAFISAVAALKACHNDSLANQLEFLWPKVAYIYHLDSALAKDNKPDTKQIRQDSLRGLASKVYDELGDLPKSQSGMKPFARVMRGSLNRLKKSMEARLASKDESDKDKFDNFSFGYKRVCYLPNLLGRDIADKLYDAINDGVAAEDMSLENSLAFPLVLYHARQGLGLAFGTFPGFHTPYLKIDGSANGFRFLQGIPIRYPDWVWKFLPTVGAEVGFHTLAQEMAYRHNFIGYLENCFSLGPVPVGINAGIGLETSFDLKPRGPLWPRAEVHVYDVFSLGFDYLGRGNFFKGNYGYPMVSVGTRLGFNSLSVMRGTHTGWKKQRRVP